MRLKREIVRDIRRIMGDKEIPSWCIDLVVMKLSNYVYNRVNGKDSTLKAILEGDHDRKDISIPG